MSPRAIAGVALVLAAAGANAAVFRCTDGDGRVTYQDSECAGAANGQATNIPTDFPPPNTAERALILKREAELEQRLEARRERESRELAMRIASNPAPAPAPEPAYTEAYPLYFPVAMPRYPHHPQRGFGRPNGPRPMPYRP